jgi:hypothetical protein
MKENTANIQIGFIILAHDNPREVRCLVNILTQAGHKVVVHFDAKSAKEQILDVFALEAEKPNQVRVISKVPCVWGEWSLVEAVITALQVFDQMSDKPHYIHLMSASDIPIRPINDLQEFLRRNPEKDFIECCDITNQTWVKGGLSIERLEFYFPVNFRTKRSTFDLFVYLQRKFKIKRKIPLGLIPHMGSQWWTLRWSTCKKILNYISENPRLIRYFRSTWIPDESFFQTVIAKLIPRSEIANLQLMLHHLTPYGRPYVAYRDHIPVIRKLPHFFIRKVSLNAISDIEALVFSRKSSIPRISHLEKVRNTIHNAIDENYKFLKIVPGHPYGERLIAEDKNVVFFITNSEKEISVIRNHAIIHDQAIWCGRPYAPDAIDIPEDLMLETGLTREMHELCSIFPQQYADTIYESLAKNNISVFVFQKGDLISAFKEMLLRYPNIYQVSININDLSPELFSISNLQITESGIKDFLDRIVRVPGLTPKVRQF